MTPEDHPILKHFVLHGWTPDPTLSDDENYMDMVLLLTRNSKCHQEGHMGCVIVQRRVEPRTIIKNNDMNDNNINNINNNNDNKKTSSSLPSLSLLDRIVAAANNTSVYHEGNSDVHAEINAIGQAAAYGRATQNCIVYITRPPCKRCFGALLAAGMSRIVVVGTSTTNTTTTESSSSSCGVEQDEPNMMARVAKERNIEMVVMQMKNDDGHRIERFLPKPSSTEMEKNHIQQLRRQNRRAKQERKKQRQKEQQQQQQQPMGIAIATTTTTTLERKKRKAPIQAPTSSS